MPLPYENATSGDKAFAEIQKVLGRFGCDNYGIMQKAKDQVTLVQFDWNGRTVQLPGHWGGYATTPLGLFRAGFRPLHRACHLERGAITHSSILPGRSW